MYKIGELSKLSNIPVKTLRYYDSEGILLPDKIDDFTGYRYYSAAKLSDCYRIITLKELGFSLQEIKELFALPKEEFFNIIAAKEEDLQRIKLQTEHRIASLRRLNSALKENRPMFDIVIRKSDELDIAYCRRIICSKGEYKTVFAGMLSSLPKDIIGGRRVVIDYETEFVSGNLDTGFGIEITGKLPKDSRLVKKTLSFIGDTASLVCSENEYGEAVKYINKFVLDNNYQITGPTYKIIYDDGTVEVKLPVKKLGQFNEELNEDIDPPFVNDELVIGRWEMFDVLPSKEMFNPQKSKVTSISEWVRELYFLPQGERYWCFGWTKGMLLSNCGYPHRKSRNKYTLEKIGNETFMFIEFKAYSYFEGGLPEIWVLKKADSKAYTKRDIMIEDEIPDLPADDNRVIGKWQVCDLVRDPGDFDPNNTCDFIPFDALYWRSAEFLTDGDIINTFKNYEDKISRTDEPGVWRWVNGYVICQPKSTASSYVVRELDGKKYLFIQWKSGDYTFGGEQPFWYVFER